MIVLRFISAFLWRSVTFRHLVLVLVRKFPGPVADFLAINTPLLVALHKLFIECGDFENAARIVEDLRTHRGVWSL